MASAAASNNYLPICRLVIWEFSAVLSAQKVQIKTNHLKWLVTKDYRFVITSFPSFVPKYSQLRLAQVVNVTFISLGESVSQRTYGKENNVYFKIKTLIFSFIRNNLIQIHKYRDYE